jgi:hypothetical protein
VKVGEETVAEGAFVVVVRTEKPKLARLFSIKLLGFQQ